MKRAASMKPKHKAKPKEDPKDAGEMSGMDAGALAKIQAAVAEAQAAIAEDDPDCAAAGGSGSEDPRPTAASAVESCDASLISQDSSPSLTSSKLNARTPADVLAEESTGLFAEAGLGSSDPELGAGKPKSKAQENFEVIQEVDETHASSGEASKTASAAQEIDGTSEAPSISQSEAAVGREASAEGAEMKTSDEFADLPPVLIAAAEAAPLAKTGGLADVVGALPKYLKRLGVDARIIMPFHRIIKERYRNDTVHLFDYNMGGQWASRFVGIDKLELDGTIYYFVDNEYYFGGEIYSGDNFEGEQYGFFVQAVCDAIPNLDFDPGIVHCNDWHTALVPFKLKAKAKRENWWPQRTLLTIHNLAFQGMFGPELNAKLIGGDEYNYAWDLGAWNMMKAGVDTADMVNTVSPTYAWEITTPEFGEGLQNDLRSISDQGRLAGILNGIDDDKWNPATDTCIPAHYSTGDMSGKRECKRALLEELGLEQDLDTPLFAMVGRLTPQKGIHLATHIIESTVPQGAMYVILGSGYPELEQEMRECEWRHKGRVCSYIGYNGDLSHRIYAAADFFLMPSAFEPCGISQMIAMRYGTLPIVHETGGLKDTVQPYNQYTGEGVGFSFSRFDGWDAVEACNRALSVFPDKSIMSRLVQNAMESDFGFECCARSYAELYRRMVQ